MTSTASAEDIITLLSKSRALFVIARNSTFTYKGRAADIKQVGQELGVRYVLKGSERKAGSQRALDSLARLAAHLRWRVTLSSATERQTRITHNWEHRAARRRATLSARTPS
jgi:hypothetical protein